MENNDQAFKDIRAVILKYKEMAETPMTREVIKDLEGVIRSNGGFVGRILCPRCVEYTNIHTTSHMNLDDICPKCNELEKKHPKYREAADRELSEVREGNLNYKGLFYGQKWPFGHPID